MIDYFLPHHVYFCYRGDALVFLDLRRDDYTLVNGVTANALRALSVDRRANKVPPEFFSALKELTEGGLLTTDRNAGRDIAPTKIDLAMEPLVDADAMPKIHMITGHIWHFVAACNTAAVQLRYNRLEDTVRGIAQRKARYSSLKPVSMEKARELTAIFQKLRSFFPINYLCLYDSLALIEFLARYKIFPSCVFGIRLEPWSAHCWVQEAQFVFNEGVEEAAGYTPVMVI